MPRGTSTAARVAAPVAFLVAATLLVLMVRAALDSGEPVAITSAPAETQAAGQETETATATEETNEAEEAQPPPQPPAQTEPPASATYYVIQSGDTLESIASRHDTTVERLLELNPGIDPVALTVGERIRVT